MLSSRPVRRRSARGTWVPVAALTLLLAACSGNGADGSGATTSEAAERKASAEDDQDSETATAPAEAVPADATPTPPGGAAYTPERSSARALDLSPRDRLELTRPTVQGSAGPGGVSKPSDDEVAAAGPAPGTVLFGEAEGSRWAVAEFPGLGRPGIEARHVVVQPPAAGAWLVAGVVEGPDVGRTCPLPISLARVWKLDAYVRRCGPAWQAGAIQRSFYTLGLSGVCRTSLGAKGSAIDCTTTSAAATLSWDGAATAGPRGDGSPRTEGRLVVPGELFPVEMPDVTYRCSARGGALTCRHPTGAGFTIDDQIARKIG